MRQKIVFYSSFLGLHFYHIQCEYNVSHFDVIGLQGYQNLLNNDGRYATQGHSESLL